jgi:hypothetical protein
MLLSFNLLLLCHYAICPMPYAICPMPYAICPILLSFNPIYSITVFLSHSPTLLLSFNPILLLKWWDRLTVNLRMKRRKRYLAEVMGNYSYKARAFARIKLFIFNYVGSFDRSGRAQKLGGFHLREYRRRHRLRKALHNWWNKCVDMINLELVVDFDHKRLLRTMWGPWFRWSHELVVNRRMEEVTRENEVRFRRMMED